MQRLNNSEGVSNSHKIDAVLSTSRVGNPTGSSAASLIISNDTATSTELLNSHPNPARVSATPIVLQQDQSNAKLTKI